MCHVIYTFFWDLPLVKYNCAKFHHCRICVADFRKGVPKRPPHPWAAPKTPILNRVKCRTNFCGFSEIRYLISFLVRADSWKMIFSTNKFLRLFNPYTLRYFKWCLVFQIERNGFQIKRNACHQFIYLLLFLLFSSEKGFF